METTSKELIGIFCPVGFQVSRLHRIQSDEVWHFYLGGAMTVVELTTSGAKLTTLGPDVLGTSGALLSFVSQRPRQSYHVRVFATCLGSPQKVQYVVKAGTWFGSFPNEGTPYSLVGCTVAPGFSFEVCYCLQLIVTFGSRIENDA